MRRRGKVDGNQRVIADAARKLGCTVATLSDVGAGVPDLLLGFRGHNLLVEVKDPAQAPNKRALTPDQEAWHSTWRGRAVVIETPEGLASYLNAVAQGDNRWATSIASPPR